MKRLEGRMNESPYPLIPVPEAVKIVLEHTKTLPTVSVPLKEASGLILAAEVHADAPLPPFPASMKDGYAVCAEVRFLTLCYFFLQGHVM
jgi:molybdopterin biosynthesis enzyme